jgi:hypothetical protein
VSELERARVCECVNGCDPHAHSATSSYAPVLLAERSILQSLVQRSTNTLRFQELRHRQSKARELLGCEKGSCRRQQPRHRLLHRRDRESAGVTHSTTLLSCEGRTVRDAQRGDPTTATRGISRYASAVTGKLSRGANTREGALQRDASSWSMPGATMHAVSRATTRRPTPDPRSSPANHPAVIMQVCLRRGCLVHLAIFS